MINTQLNVNIIADNLGIRTFPFKKMGIPIGRNVTLIRLDSGGVIIHSTGPFSAEDAAMIREFGAPVAVLETTNFHDTFTRSSSAVFNDVPCYVPPGFPSLGGCETQPLSRVLNRWPELAILPVDGMPMVAEHVVLHKPTRTLIVADLVFNYDDTAPIATRRFFRWAAGIRHFPGMSRFFKMMIRDRGAFGGSMRQILQWNFDRIIVGHGEIIESDAQEKLRRALPAWAQ